MTASSPQFFRTVLQRNLEDRKLMIPKKFVKDHGGKFLSSSVRLKLPDGMEWKVGLTTAPNGVIWMQKGWHKFAEHYSLEFGSLLVFKLDGSSTFHTTIFDPTGVETEYSCNFNDSRREFEENGDDDSDPDESLESFPRRSRKREKVSFPACRQSRKKMRNDDSFSIKTEPEEEGCDIIRDMPSSKKRKQKDEVGGSRRRQRLANKAEAAVQRFSSKSKKPGFKVVLEQPNLGGKFDMIIPKEFAEKYLPDEFGMIKLQTANGKNWPLLYKWSRNRGNFAYISSGWNRFVEKNPLKEGDVGFFQLIKKNTFSFTKLQGIPPSLSPSPKKKTSTARNNPVFEVDIHFRSYKNLILNIPMVFAKEHFLPEMHSAKLQVGNKQWIVALKQYHSCVRFSAGWCTFYGDNGLEDGDACLFEMVNKRKCVFKVTIFKKVTSSASMN